MARHFLVRFIATVLAQNLLVPISDILLSLALPISIFLGVTVFFLTQYVLQPWVHEVLRLPFYV